VKKNKLTLNYASFPALCIGGQCISYTGLRTKKLPDE